MGAAVGFTIGLILRFLWWSAGSFWNDLPATDDPIRDWIEP